MENSNMRVRGGGVNGRSEFSQKFIHFGIHVKQVPLDNSLVYIEFWHKFLLSSYLMLEWCFAYPGTGITYVE